MIQILRIITALIFIASGFVKSVDVVGFSFKLEEYFSPDVFNMPYFERFALPIAVIVVVLELLLGFLLLLKIRLKFTLAALIALCVFFAFLTFYSAYFNKVTDCGCFGDAIKFTPWQSFFKDIALLGALLILWFVCKKHFSRLQPKKNWEYTALAILTATMGFIIVYGISHEPLIDFRDYKIGTDLNAEIAKTQKNPSEYKTFYSLVNKQTGAIVEVNQDEYVANKKYWQNGTPWTIEEGKTTSKMVKEGYTSEITKFKPETIDGQDLTQKILQAPHAVLIFSYAPKKADGTVIAMAEKKVLASKNAYLMGISTAPDTFKTIPNALMDATAIKTIARSNPFVLVLKNGIVTDKMSAKDYINK